MADHGHIAPSTTPPSFPPASLSHDQSSHPLTDPALLQSVESSIHDHHENTYQPVQHHGAFDMAPPPETTHASFADLHAFAQSHAAIHGYALSINTTAKNRARVKLACVCYGAPKNTHHLTDETRVRKKRQSSKTGCRMWVEGKKLNDGTWVLKVGEGQHNHEGRNVEEWAVHRRRTWGLGGGGGGIVAGAVPAGKMAVEHLGDVGETVWRIVEEEMDRGNSNGGGTIAPGSPDDGGRDRGVGRTVRILQDKLPGIQIFKRDVYNIRAQIKKLRKQPDEEGNISQAQAQALASADDPEAFAANLAHHSSGQQYGEIDPALVAQFNVAHDSNTAHDQGSGQTTSHAPTANMLDLSNLASFAQAGTATEEANQLRSEVERLRSELQRIRANSAGELQRLNSMVERLEEEKEEAVIEVQKMKVENEQLRYQLMVATRKSAAA